MSDMYPITHTRDGRIISCSCGWGWTADNERYKVESNGAKQPICPHCLGMHGMSAKSHLRGLEQIRRLLSRTHLGGQPHAMAKYWLLDQMVEIDALIAKAIESIPTVPTADCCGVPEVSLAPTPAPLNDGHKIYMAGVDYTNGPDVVLMAEDAEMDYSRGR